MESLDAFFARIGTLNRGGFVAQAFEPAGSGDFPVARSWSTGLESPVNPQAGKPALQAGSWRASTSYLARIGTMNRGGFVAQAFEPAGSGDFPVARSWSTGLESPVNPQAGKPALQVGSWGGNGMHGRIGRDRGDEPGSAADFDFAERRRLDDHDLLQADQLEQRQKRHHDLGAAGGFLEQIGRA